MIVAALQMNVGGRKDDNLVRAVHLIDEAARRGARFVMLPEYVVYRGPESRYADVAESVPGPTTTLLAGKAREHNIFIHGGSLLEFAPQKGKFFNTSVLIDSSGSVRAVYRKVHLFDVEVTGEVARQESRLIAPGDELVVAELPEFTLGMSICYDLRFPELFRALAEAGATVMALPAAFAAATGRFHWEILVRARAIENHAYVIAAAEWGVCGGFPTHGHSMIVDPWGTVLCEAADGDTVLTAEVSGGEAQRRRGQIPVLSQRRRDVYERPVHAYRAGDGA